MIFLIICCIISAALGAYLSKWVEQKNQSKTVESNADNTTDSKDDGALAMCALMLELDYILDHIDASHGISHAQAVAEHAFLAIRNYREYVGHISIKQELIIVLAALLHDVDDKKFFEPNSDNASRLLDAYFPQFKTKVLKCIDLVSCSDNGNTIDPNIPFWMYIPRFCDRIESIGIIGIERCLEYSKHKNRPEFNSDTPRATTIDELDEIATPERFQLYQETKDSTTVIDHFYDKLLHLKYRTGIPYIDYLMKQNHQVMVDYVLYFGQTGQLKQITDDM